MFNFILEKSFKFHAEKSVCQGHRRCAGRGPGLVALRFPLVPLNWISDDIRKNHLVH